ncbi:dihydrofolate reductase [Irregularibacter muris]|uniref:Dihydrofolate reductase n=1 Tax=Irregularibacter muris TaxID=1796619 RepID=A0AAE3HEE8_9FIRM|nr:dihydrofolate reductase [Irregularibacter muris]MCR1897709.1 dihydrofolate reductase [Irregularibacter muris]
MISMIVAMDQNNGIGKNNDLLAHIKPDLSYFKKVTQKHTVIMGYHTYMSLPIRPLPNRQNIVVTRKNIDIEGAIVLHSIQEILQWIEDHEDDEVFICGGASIYEQFMPYAEKLYITHIFHSFDADTFFPKIGQDWEIKNVQATRENIEHQYPHVFTLYQRKVSSL